MLFEQILSLIPCAVFWKDADGVFQGCNEQFLKFSGIKNKSHLLGKTDKELPWADQWEKYYKDDQQVISSQETITRIEEVALPDRKITAHTTKTPWMKDGKCVGVLGVIYDISELMEAKEKAEAANHLKTEFIQNMQHDIRTPASGVWSMLRTLADQESDPEEKKILILVRDSAKQLYDICNDVIDFDRAERGEMPVTSKKLSVTHLVSNVVDLNRAIAFKKNLNISFSVDEKIPTVLKGDEHRINRILINLVSNAMKFTQKGEVKILAKLIKMEEKTVIVQFEIHDTGPGIPPEKKDYIYEKFTRGTPANQNVYKGSGLGLQIVKKFVTDLGGEIDVHSEVDKGTTFYVTLPLEKPLVDEIYDEEEEGDKENINNSNTSEPKIKTENASNSNSSANNAIPVLLIEDDRLAQMVSANVIKTAGCEVTLVETVEKAKEALSKHKFKLVISDIGLPDGTGFDIVRAAKTDPNSPNHLTPFFALTAHSDEDKKKEAIESGFATVMTKPLTPEQMKDILHLF